MRNAADRVLVLNPLNQNCVGVAGMGFVGMGDWDRGLPMVRRAIDLDPNHYGLLHRLCTLPRTRSCLLL